MGSDGPKQACIRWGPDPLCEGAIIRGKGHARACFTILCRELCKKMTEPIDLPFGLWILVGRRKHKFNRVRQVGPMFPRRRAHWRHLTNTIELSVCGGGAALCQITLTTCSVSGRTCPARLSCRVVSNGSVLTYETESNSSVVCVEMARSS